MVVLRIVLIILFFLVLACKPTYLMYEGERNGKQGTGFLRTPLFFALILMYRFDDLYLTDRKTFEYFYNISEQKKKMREDD